MPMKIIIVVVLLVFIIIGGLTILDSQGDIYYDGGSVSESLTSEANSVITVTLSGEVVIAGTYEIFSGDYLLAALQQAGGVTPDADSNCFDYYLVVEESIEIYIPKDSDVEKVSINNDDLDKLLTLTGIGQTLGNRIITYREISGPFLYLEQIMKVEGIGPSIFNKIKDYICL